MSDLPSGENRFLPEEAFSIADALATRGVQDELEFAQIKAEVEGIPFHSPSPEESKRSHMGRAILNMARVSDPSVPVSLAESLRVTLDKVNLDKMAANLSEYDYTVTGDMVETVHLDIAEFFEEQSGLTAEYSAELFRRGLDTARIVAQERGVSVVDVILDDVLYKEASSRSTPVEECKNVIKTLLRTTTGDVLLQGIMKSLTSIIPKEILEEFSEEEIQEVIEEIKSDTEIRSELVTAQEQLAETVRQFAVYKIAKIYGSLVARTEVMTDDELKPTRPLAHSVVNSLLDN